MPAIDIVDSTWICARPGVVAAIIADPANWRRWWPELDLSVDEWRGDKGVRWSVRRTAHGDSGSMEVWLEQSFDGVVAHYFLRLDPADGAAQSAVRAVRRVNDYRRRVKQIFWGMADDLDPGRINRTAAPPRDLTRPGNLSGMAEQSTQSIVIDAEPAAIMAVIADFPNYPSWTGSVKRAEVTETGSDGRARRVAFVLDAGVVRDQYELVYEWSGDERVQWELVRGQMMRAQTGSYVLEPIDGPHTRVTYSLTVDLAIPMLGLLKRKAERVVMDTALKELKKRVESART